MIHSTSLRCLFVEALEPRTLRAVGDLDTSFGAGGTVDLPGPVVAYRDAKIFPLSDGRIVVAQRQVTDVPYLQRILPGGAIDSSFAAQNLSSALAARIGDPVAYVAAGDSILVRGTGLESQVPGHEYLTRVNAASRLHRVDPHFGHNGVVHLPFVNSSFDRSHVEPLAGGRVAVSGVSRVVVDQVDDRQVEWGVSIISSGGAGGIDTRYGDHGVATIETRSTSADVSGGASGSSDLISGERMFGLADERVLCIRGFVHSSATLGIPDSFTVRTCILQPDGTITQGSTLNDYELGGATQQLAGGAVVIALDRAGAVVAHVTVDADGTFHDPVAVDSPVLEGDDITYANDGNRLDLESGGVETLAKHQTSEGPTGVLVAPPLRVNREGGYRFAITWHDDDKVDLASLAGGVIVRGLAGFARTAVLDSTSSAVDAQVVTATYHVRSADAAGWSSAESGVYTIFVRRHHVTDATSHHAMARPLGQFSILIPAPSEASGIIEPSELPSARGRRPLDDLFDEE